MDGTRTSICFQTPVARTNAWPSVSRKSLTRLLPAVSITSWLMVTTVPKARLLSRPLARRVTRGVVRLFVVQMTVVASAASARCSMFAMPVPASVCRIVLGSSAAMTVAAAVVVSVRGSVSVICAI